MESVTIAEGQPVSGVCPFAKTVIAVDAAVAGWWPNKLNLKPLGKAAPASVCTSKAYADSLKKLDVAALKADLVTLLKDSQDWWPADYGA